MLKTISKTIRELFNRVMNQLTSFFNPAARQKEHEHEQKQIEEEQREICELAGKFDNLHLAGFNQILEVAWSKVNSSIAEATEYPLEPTKQAVCVSRWDAQRALMDAVIAYIDDTKKRRDEIEEQRRMAREAALRPPMHTWDWMGQSGQTGL